MVIANASEMPIRKSIAPRRFDTLIPFPSSSTFLAGIAKQSPLCAPRQMPNPNPLPTNLPKNCGHQQCNCLATQHSSYCSDDCEHAARLDGTSPCPCKHLECH